jgi:hypothetical protein
MEMQNKMNESLMFEFIGAGVICELLCVCSLLFLCMLSSLYGYWFCDCSPFSVFSTWMVNDLLTSAAGKKQTNK